MQTVIIAVAAAGALSALYLGCRWALALAEVTRGLEALGTGAKVRPIRSGAGGPIGKLVSTFNASAPECQTQIAHLDQERRQLLVVLEAMAEAVIAVDPRCRLLFA